MNAIEFVKKYDIQTAKDAISNMPKHWDSCYLKDINFEFVKSPPSVHDWVCMEDLKQIVEAFELVESYGGINKAKNEDMYCTIIDENGDYQEYRNDELEQAINLVEQCQ